MNTYELNKKLDKAITDFSAEIQMSYKDADKTPADLGDISELARQTFYALDIFRKEIVAYLESNK